MKKKKKLIEELAANAIAVKKSADVVESPIASAEFAEEAKFTARWAEISEAIQAGWNLRQIWSVMKKKRQVLSSYQWFAKLAKRQLLKEQSVFSTPKEKKTEVLPLSQPATSATTLSIQEQMAEFRAKQAANDDAGKAEPAESVPKPVRKPVIAVPSPPIDLNSGNLPENYEEIVKRLVAPYVPDTENPSQERK